MVSKTPTILKFCPGAPEVEGWQRREFGDELVVGILVQEGLGGLKRFQGATIGTIAVALGLIAVVKAENPPSGWRGVGSGSGSKASRSSDAPRDPAVSRASMQQPGPTLLPPVSDSQPLQRAPVPPPPVPLDALPGDDPSGLVSIHYDNTDLRQVLEIFSRREKMNLLVSPNISGPITLNLDGVTRQQAFEAILALGNLVAQRTGGLTYVYTSDEFKALNLSRRKVVTRVYRLNYIRANEMARMLTGFLSPDAKVTATVESEEGIDENANFAAGLPSISTGSGGGGSGGARGGGTGTTGGNTLSGGDVVIVQDYPENLAIVEEMISKLDIMPEQVLIEAVIIRVDLNRNQQLGVNFGAVDQMHSLLGVIGDSSQFGQTVGFAPLKLLNTNGSVAGVSATGGNTVTGTQFGNSGYGIKFGYIGGNASTFVQALETLGKTNVLATPRVLVLNKQRAEIQLGQRLGYKTLVTNLTSTVQQVQFLNTGTLLRLRPFISDDSMIRMEIHPERSTGLIDANGVPQTNTARMTTNIVIPNGATLVIGGLIDNQDDTTQSGVPGLNRLPVVGALFRNKNQDVIKSEVVILLTPRIWNAADPEGLNCAPTPKTALDTATRVSQKIELGADRPFRDGILGGRLYYDTPNRADRLQATDPGKNPYTHTVKSGENFWTISKLYYRSGRYYMALWSANKKLVAAPDRLAVGDKIVIPRADQLDPEMIQPLPAPVAAPAPVFVPPPPPENTSGPFGLNKTRDSAAKVAGQTTAK
jgi:type IV pilus secretin PilQ/predicted competence protein